MRKTKVEFWALIPDEWNFLLGIEKTSGEDEDGVYEAFSMGCLLFGFSIIKYMSP